MFMHSPTKAPTGRAASGGFRRKMAISANVALVTGGARRIGRAIVEDLAAHGWAVAIHYHRSRTDAETVAGHIRSAGGKVALVRGDLLRIEDLGRIVAESAGVLGDLTLLVNNASIFERDTVGALDLDLFDRQMAV